MNSRKKKLVFTGLGFPVELVDVPIVKIQGEWTPDIDSFLLEKYVLTKLAKKEGRLSGDEIHFIRLHRQMTLQFFGLRFGVTHPAVKKWESAGENDVNANWSTEKDIRMFAVENFFTPVELAELYKALEKPRMKSISQPLQVRVADLDSVKPKRNRPPAIAPRAALGR